MNIEIALPGYTVEKLREPEAGEIDFSYLITSPKGKTWKLLRNKPNAKMLFPIPENVHKGSFSIKGIKWFTDRNGTLEAIKRS